MNIIWTATLLELLELVGSTGHTCGRLEERRVCDPLAGDLRLPGEEVAPLQLGVDVFSGLERR